MNADNSPNLEELWQFSGQGLRSGEFNTAMVHFYRGEVSRSVAWRQRLDTTTNWAVITTGAALTFTFGAVSNTHTIIIVDAFLVLLFLLMEARRYRYYELWTYRVRLMESNFFAALLSPPFLPDSDWADKVTESLKNPQFPISLAEAFGRRYRRNYAPIFFVLAFGWILKVLLHPSSVQSWHEFMDRAAVGPVPGWLMILLGILFHSALMAVGIMTIGLRDAQGEILQDETPSFVGNLWRRLRRLSWDAFEVDPQYLPFVTRLSQRQQLAYIISDQSVTVSTAILEELNRGVTQLEGKGMYTGKEHGVLLCTCNVNETHKLKSIVKRFDPHALVIITNTEDVLGAGFQPLET